MPKGGFGNLIALPLQKKPRDNGCSVFADSALQPHPDQWAFLASIQPMSKHDIEPTILRATGSAHPLDVTFVDDEDLKEPWKRSSPDDTTLAGPMPKSLTLTIANLVYFEKAQAMRFPVWDKPRVICCASTASRARSQMNAIWVSVSMSLSRVRSGPIRRPP